MEAQFLADRTRLRHLMREHPTWRIRDFAVALNRSIGWVKKWMQRLRLAPPDDDQVLHSRSRARKTPPLCISAIVMLAILRIRDHPPENLRRTPGPKAILYYLHRDESLRGHYLPRSTRTIWKVLKDAGRMAERFVRCRIPLDRPPPYRDITLTSDKPDDSRTWRETNCGTSSHANASRTDRPTQASATRYGCG